MTDEERQELLSLYQVTAQDLVFFKSQQWALLNYTLLGLAAVVAISQLSNVSDIPCYKLILGGSALVVALFGNHVERSLYHSISERRNRLDRVYEQLSDLFNEARGNKSQVPAKVILHFIQCIMFGALAFTCLIVFIS